MTITLQDVAIIQGLWIHGPPVINTCEFYVSLLCQELIGVIPPLTDLRGFAISTGWLSQQLSAPPIDADKMTLERNARGFILSLRGSFLFANKKGLHVHLCYLHLL